MGITVTLRADNDNCPHARLKRAVKLLEQAVEKNKLACQEFKKTISDLRESVQNLEEGTNTFQKKMGEIAHRIQNVNGMSKKLVEIMDRVTD